MGGWGRRAVVYLYSEVEGQYFTFIQKWGANTLPFFFQKVGSNIQEVGEGSIFRKGGGKYFTFIQEVGGGSILLLLRSGGR